MKRSVLFAGLMALAGLVMPAGALAGPKPVFVFSQQKAVEGEGGAVETEGGLYAVRGEDVDELTENPTDAEPSFSPDGSTIVFVREGDLFSIRPDGTGERRITSGPEVDSRPQFAAEGKAIVFERAAAPGAPRDLYVVGPRGANPRALTATADDDHEAAVSPEDKVIVFVRGGATPDAIYSIRLGGGKLTRLTRGPDDSFAPLWFEGGIVFDRGESGPAPAGYSDIYSMRDDGSKLRKLVGGASSVYLQDITPDGETMLFSRYEALCVKRIAHGAPHRVAPLPDEVEVQARYSADGTRLAIRTEGGGEVPETAQRLFQSDARFDAGLEDLASAEDSGEMPSSIGSVFAWQPKVAGAY